MEHLINVHIEKLPEGVYLATSEDVQGLVAQGRTIVETLEIARDVARHQILREARRKGLNAKDFVLGLLRDHLATQTSSNAERSESGLLEEINQGFPAEHWKRYGELVTKRQAETLTAEEHAEMLAMIQIREEANVHRVECLAELARRRQVPLRVLMDQMGIEPTIND